MGGSLGFDVRILILQGQGIDRTLPEFNFLDALCYVDNGQNAAADSFYHADDAAGTIRNINGDFLILPDMRGQFLRGFDPGGLVDPDGVSRIRPGSSQLDAFQNITGSVLERNSQGGDTYFGLTGALLQSNFTGADLGNIYSTQGCSTPSRGLQFDASDSPGARTSTESRSVNLSVRWGIYF